MKERRGLFLEFIHVESKFQGKGVFLLLVRLLQAIHCHYDQNGKADLYINATIRRNALYESWGMRNVKNNGPKGFDKIM